jgi:hypothetical protein
MLHIAKQLDRDGLVLDAFVVERQHLLIKHVADKIKNTVCFERSVMSAVVNVCMMRVADMHEQSKLLGRHAPLPGCDDIIVADSLQSGDVELSRGDVASYGGELGLVVCGYKRGPAFGVFAEVLSVRHRLAEHSVVAVRTGRLSPWLACDVTLCAAWQYRSADELLVVCR